jgi:hypothetical protein
MAMLMSPTEFELIPQFAMCVMTLAGALAVFAAASGIVLLGRYLLQSTHRWRSKRP